MTPMLAEVIFSFFAFLVLCILSIIYISSRIRRQDMEILRSTNTDLRAAIDDKGKEIAEMRTKISKLEDRIVGLEHSNLTLEQLVSKALGEYFQNNPKIALTLSKQV